MECWLPLYRAIFRPHNNVLLPQPRSQHPSLFFFIREVQRTPWRRKKKKSLSSHLSASLQGKLLPPSHPYTMNVKAIPDLRFEQSFRKSLQANSLNGEAKTKDALPIITPGIVIYTVLKEQILMPFLQGFLWASILLSFKPWLIKVAQKGRKTGNWLFSEIGIRPKRSIWETFLFIIPCAAVPKFN